MARREHMGYSAASGTGPHARLEARLEREMPRRAPTKDPSIVGGLFAAAAFGAWGVLPLYFKALDQVPPLQVLSHRILWSALLLAGLVAMLRRWSAIGAALGDRRTLVQLAGSTLLICVNWLTFIWAVHVERVMEVSLGYYINPLVNVALGVLVLRERLTAWQAAALALAMLGVGNLAFQADGLPWPSLVVAVSFGLYGLVRKTTQLGSIEGLFLETSLVAPLALFHLLYASATGSGSFGAGDQGTDVLLASAGVITALPLIWFASGVRRLTYTAVGFFQYLAPTGHFLLAVLAFGEPFTQAHQITFGAIWAGLAIFSIDSVRRARSRTRRPRTARLSDTATNAAGAQARPGGTT